MKDVITHEIRVLFGLDAHPRAQILVRQFSFFHEFVSMHREILMRYTRACDYETALKNFSILAQDFDEAADSFDYEALKPCENATPTIL